MLVDLHHECLQLTFNAIDDRIKQLVQRLPPTSLTAIGGFPIIQKSNSVYGWCGVEFTSDIDIQNVIRQALGLSAVLTYTNPKYRSLNELGDLCFNKKHFWALHWINISITFSGNPPEVELAFARDNRFLLSWIVKSIPQGKIFTATAGIKEWLDYTAHKDDDSFDSATRIAMHQSYEIIKRIIP